MRWYFIKQSFVLLPLWVQANRCSCSLCLCSPYGTTAHPPPLHLPSLGPLPGRLVLGSQRTGNRMTWALVSSTTEATQSLLDWMERKLVFALTLAQSNCLLTNARSDLKQPFSNVTSNFPLKRGYQRLLVSSYKAMKSPLLFPTSCQQCITGLAVRKCAGSFYSSF